MPTKITLKQVWGAFVNQSTLEDAADWMADLARDDHFIRAEIFECLIGAEAWGGDLSELVSAVNCSGYKVGSIQEAKDMCAELLRLFAERLERFR